MHGDHENWMWTCKRCNAIQANLFKGAGLGKRTRAVQPTGARGGAQMAEYAAAIKVMRGEFDDISGGEANQDGRMPVAVVRQTRGGPGRLKGALTGLPAGKACPVRNQRSAIQAP